MGEKLYYGTISRGLFWLNTGLAIFYISWWFNISHAGNPILYYLLFFGEIYHVFMAIIYWSTVAETDKIRWQPKKFDPAFAPSVDVFIPVAGEPVEIIRATVEAAKKLVYPNFKIHILNDGRVAGKPDWQAVEVLAGQMHVGCFTREIPHGAKAGNINDALAKTNGELIVIFDADMTAKENFLRETVPYFSDDSVGFVQTPQYYHNYAVNDVTGGAWEQQELFFGPIMKGKDKDDAAFICGTNVVIRRKALVNAGGFYEKSIAEDFLTSLFIHQSGWHSVYIPQILSRGLAPEDLMSYYKQQLRWSTGSLQVLFTKNPFFMKGLTFRQKLQYLASALFYVNGVIVLIDMVMPLLYMFFGWQAVVSTTTINFAFFFIPFMFFNLYTLYVSSGRNISYRALAFSHASWFLQLRSLYNVLFSRKVKFSVTPKQAQTGNFLFLAYPHLAYILLTFIGFFFALYREGFNPSIVTNIAWAIFNSMLFLPYIKASYNWSDLFGGRGSGQKANLTVKAKPAKI